MGGAFWIAFAVGVTIATITGLAYAELVTKYPRAAGAPLYVHQAFRNRPLTFLVTSRCCRPASPPRARWRRLRPVLRRGVGVPPALLIALVFLLVLAVVNFLGITESVVATC